MSNLLQHTVSALARLSFYENLFIGHETSVLCPCKLASVLVRLNLEKMYGLCTRTLQTVCNDEMSILSGCLLRAF